MRLMYCWHANNISLINEFNMIYSNMAETEHMNYPESIPVLFLLSKSTVDGFNQLEMDWIDMHEKVVLEQTHSRIVVFNGSHYLHATCSTDMAQEIEEFLGE